MITLQAILAKYAMQIVGGLLAVAVLVGGYYYWKHSIASDAIAERDAQWQERDRKDIKHAAEIMASENAKIEIIKQYYQDQYDNGKEKLHEYIETLTAANASANANVIRAAQRQNPKSG